MIHLRFNLKTRLLYLYKAHVHVMSLNDGTQKEKDSSTLQNEQPGLT